MPEYGALSRSIFDGKCSFVLVGKYIAHFIRKALSVEEPSEALYFLTVAVRLVEQSEGEGSLTIAYCIHKIFSKLK